MARYFTSLLALISLCSTAAFAPTFTRYDIVIVMLRCCFSCWMSGTVFEERCITYNVSYVIVVLIRAMQCITSTL